MFQPDDPTHQLRLPPCVSRKPAILFVSSGHHGSPRNASELLFPPAREPCSPAADIHRHQPSREVILKKYSHKLPSDAHGILSRCIYGTNSFRAL
jgi:hypothetical protein